MSFYLWDDHDAKLRLKSFSSTARGEKMTIKIEVETSDPGESGWALRTLAEVQKGQRTKPKPESKPKPLALPAPRLALSRPEDL